MTQGLQFSLMFSGLDSRAAVDSSAAATGFYTTDDIVQGGGFQQLLEEQQPSSPRAGQHLAATQSKIDKTTTELAAQNKVATVTSNVVNEDSIDGQTVAEIDAPEQLDIAGQWLGLIRQANDTSQQLQQKMKFSTQQATMLNAGIEHTTHLGDGAAELAVSENSAANVNVSLAALTDLTAVLTTTKDAKANITGSNKNADASAVVTDNLSQNADKIQTDTAVIGSAKTVKALTSENLQQQDKATGIAVAAIKTANSATITPDKLEDGQLGKPSLVEQAKTLEGNQLVAEEPAEANDKPVLNDGLSSAKNNAANLPSTSVAQVDAKAPDTTLHQAVNPAELAAALEVQPETTPDRLPGITPVKPEQSKAVRLEQSLKVEPVNVDEGLVGNSLTTEKWLGSEQDARLATVQSQSIITTDNAETEIASEPAEADDSKQPAFTDMQLKENSAKSNEPLTITNAPVISRTSATDENSSKAAAVETESKQAASNVNKDNVAKDTTSSDAEGQQQQQRQDPRTTVIDRLEVSVSSAHSQHRAAGTDNAGITFAESQTQAAEQTNRTSSSQATTPSLAAHLKQLNLQQQDAALQLRERVQFMVRQNIQVAEIRLDPADLGQMQIRVNLQQEQASVQFVVQQQHTRELLEQQMPRLRELLQQQGIQLGEGQVHQQARQDRQSNEQNGRNDQHGNGGTQQHDGNEELAASRTVDVKYSERIVDYYA